jgi:Tfp pilus assembly protein PilF
MDINKTIKLALEHFQAGNLQQAENICKEVLNVQSNNITA